MYKEKENEFLSIIDGGFEYLPVIDGIGSYHLGVCKLEFIDDVLHIHLRRPGLLIGEKGKTIDKIQKILNCKIKIHEVVLGR